MTADCEFCKLIQINDKAIFYEDPEGLFVAMWTSFPAVPGHALVISKRHLQFFRDMNKAEMRRIAFVVAEVKTKIESTDLQTVCDDLAVLPGKSKELIMAAKAQLHGNGGQPPRAFNDGINDGPAAGQTIPHLHWHILPRWDNAEGGILRRFREARESL